MIWLFSFQQARQIRNNLSSSTILRLARQFTPAVSEEETGIKDLDLLTLKVINKSLWDI